jgi:hypothetical protein
MQFLERLQTLHRSLLLARPNQGAIDTVVVVVYLGQRRVFLNGHAVKLAQYPHGAQSYRKRAISNLPAPYPLADQKCIVVSFQSINVAPKSHGFSPHAGRAPPFKCDAVRMGSPSRTAAGLLRKRPRSPPRADTLREWRPARVMDPAPRGREARLLCWA